MKHALDHDQTRLFIKSAGRCMAPPHY